MTDKEQIEVYVNEIPAQCIDCRFAYDGRCQANKNGEYYCTENCRRSDCPLKSIQSVQNAKAVEALERLRKHLLDGIVPFNMEARLEVGFAIDQLTKEYGGKNERDTI